MKEIEIVFRDNLQINVEKIIESTCKYQGLNLISKNTLKKYPGCTHWHYQKPKASGTLEITFWPIKNRCWIPLRAGRTKPWVAETAQRLKMEIEKQGK